MRKSKKSKILSLMLCMSMILSTFAFTSGAAVAEETGTTAATAEQQPTDKATDSTKATTSTDATKSSQQDIDKNDITKMTVKEQFEYLTSLKTDAEKEAEIKKLSQAQYEALQAYVEEQSAAAPENGEAGETRTPAVNYTNVAPLVKNNTESTVSKTRKAKAAKNSTTPQEPTVIEGNSPDGLNMSKTATANDDGSYTLKLEAYSTGTVTSVDTTKPTDIVLVLDQSGSMSYNFADVKYEKVYNVNRNQTYYVYESGNYQSVSWCDSCNSWTNGCTNILFWHSAGTKYTPKTTESDTQNTQFYTRVTTTGTKTRLTALQDAVTGFVTNVETQADKDSVDHRIGIVGFSSNGYNNTELLTGVSITKTDVSSLKRSNRTYYYPHQGDTAGEGRDGVQYGSITNSQYQNALQDVSQASGKTSVTNAIDALTAHGGTNTLDGLDMASQIFSNDTKKGEDRNKVVILFTDGATDSDENSTIQKAKSLKDQGITVYTVGIFDGANGTPSTNVSDYTNTNKFMHFISSNYPQATGMNNGGSLNPNLKDGESYYLSAGDSDALKNIFQKISSQIGSTTINLGSQSVIRDIVSESFDMPENVSDIDVKTYDCTAYDEDTKQATWSSTGTTLQNAVTIDKDNKTIDVTGFDFSKNYVAKNGRDENDPSKTGSFHGRKIVITFKVTPRDGFWGGNNVPTNGTASGIYADKDATTPAGTFDVPTVNVPLNVPKASGKTENIYLLGDTPGIDDLYDFEIPTGDDAWKTAYVNIEVNYDENKTISNVADSDIDIEIIVSPKFTGTGADGAITDNNVQTVNGKVNVFKPELTYKDSTVYYGDIAPESYDSNKVGGTVWKHGSTVDTDVTMTGDKPELTLSYDPKPYDKNSVNNSSYYEGGVISTKNDIPVKVTVKIGSKDVTNHVTFKHTDCNPESGFNSENEQFLIHVKTCSLTVTKTGGVDGEPYVMDIYKDGNLYTSMTIVGNSSATVKELPVGTYTVQEDTKWAWRYKDPAPIVSTGVTLSDTKATGDITVTNRERYNSFLNGYSTVVQNVYGKIFDKID